MATIKLSQATSLENGTYVFKITDVQYDNDFQKLKLVLTTEDGKKMYRNFNFIDNAGNVNDGALRSFSYFARVCLHDYAIEEIDPYSLKDKFIQADVETTEIESNREAGKMVKFTNLNNYVEASDYHPSNAEDFDLDNLLK